MQRSRAMRRVGALAAGLVPAMVATWAAERAIPPSSGQIAATGRLRVRRGDGVAVRIRDLTRVTRILYVSSIIQNCA